MKRYLAILQKAGPWAFISLALTCVMVILISLAYFVFTSILTGSEAFRGADMVRVWLALITVYLVPSILILTVDRAIHYGLVYDIFTNGNFSFKRTLKYVGRPFFLFFRMLSYSIAEALLLCGILTFYLLPGIVGMSPYFQGQDYVRVFLAVSLPLLWLLTCVFFGRVFVFPLMFDKKKGGFQILWESTAYSKKNFRLLLSAYHFLLLKFLFTFLKNASIFLFLLSILGSSRVLTMGTSIILAVLFKWGEISMDLKIFKKYFSNQKGKIQLKVK